MNTANSPQSPADDQTAGKRKRRWRIWVLLAVLAALVLWMNWMMAHAKRQEQVVRKINELGGHVVYNYRGYRMSEPAGPMFLRKVLGDQYFVTLMAVTVRQWRMNVQDLADVAKGLEEVGVRTLYVNTLDFGDAIVEPLKALKSAKRLFIKDEKLSDTGLKQLQEALPNTQIRRYKSTS